MSLRYCECNPGRFCVQLALFDQAINHLGEGGFDDERTKPILGHCWRTVWVPFHNPEDAFLKLDFVGTTVSYDFLLLFNVVCKLCVHNFLLSIQLWADSSCLLYLQLLLIRFSLSTSLSDLHQVFHPRFRRSHRTALWAVDHSAKSS